MRWSPAQEILDLDVASYRVEQARKRTSTKRGEVAASAPGQGAYHHLFHLD